MEVIHYRVAKISRKSGGSATAAAAYRSGSAVAAAAYRAGEKLYNDFDGQTHDYARKGGVVYSRILLPDNAPRSFYNRGILWNEVEKIEKSVDARLCRDVNFALPRELDRYEQTQLVLGYVQDNFVNRGMCADIATHDTGGGNPHAHVLLTTRSLDENGKWLGKERKNYILDENGNKIYDPIKKQYRTGKSIKTNDWDDQENIEKWRQEWAADLNREFERKSIEKRVTHESYERQGVDREATEHMGSHLTALERKGERTARGDRNREKLARNRAKDEREREARSHNKHATTHNTGDREGTPTPEKISRTQPQGNQEHKLDIEAIRVDERIGTGGTRDKAVRTDTAGVGRTERNAATSSKPSHERGGSATMAEDRTDSSTQDRAGIAKGIGTIKTSSRIISQTASRLAKTLGVSDIPEHSPLTAQKRLDEEESSQKSTHERQQRNIAANREQKPKPPTIAQQNKQLQTESQRRKGDEPMAESKGSDTGRTGTSVQNKPEAPAKTQSHSAKRQAFDQKRATSHAKSNEQLAKDVGKILDKNAKTNDKTGLSSGQSGLSAKRREFDQKRGANQAKANERLRQQENSKSKSMDMDM